MDGALTRATVLTVAAACRALRMREGDARRWLREKGLIREVAGRRRVVWGEILDAMGAAEEEAAPRQVWRTSSMIR